MREWTLKDRLQHIIFKKDFLLILILTTIAFLCRIFLYRYYNVISTDGCEYLVAGKNLVSGLGLISLNGSPDTTYPPFYPMLSGLLYLLLGNLELAGRLVSTICGVLLVPLIYAAGIYFYKDRRVASLAATFAIIYPRLLEASCEAMSDSLFLLLLFLGILVGWIALKEDKKILYFAEGLVFGLGYLTRAVGFFYIPIAFLIILFYKIKKDKIGVIFTKALLLLLGFILIILPYLFFLHKHTGIWSLSPAAGFWQGATQNNYEEYVFNIEDTVPNQISFFYYFLNQPSFLLPKIIQGIYSMYITFLPVVIPPIFLLLIALGLFAKPWDKNERLLNMYLILMILPNSIYVFYNVQERYLFPLIPVCLLWVALGVEHFCAWIEASFPMKLKIVNVTKVKKLIGGSFIMFLLLTLVIPALKPLYIKKDEPLEHKELGLWIKENFGKGFVILSRKPWVSFYSESLWHAYPYADYEKIMDFAKNVKADFFVIDTRTIPSTRPQLEFLLDEKKAPSYLKLVKELHGAEQKILLYSVDFTKYQKGE